MKQNDAVFQAVCSVLGQDGFDSAVVLTDTQRAEVISMVTKGLIDGTVDFSAEAKAKHDTPAKVKSYTTGMVSNHLRKDKRLNGGVKYEIKNPGSRAGSSDEQLKALKLLQAQYESGSEAWHEIEAAIADRTTQINAAKKKTDEINVEALPEHLRYLIAK
jgi:hypothetical protein